MEKVVLDVPAMYADHHVLAVREALLGLSGVEEVVASAMNQQVQVTFDPEKASGKDLEQALEGAGYPAGEVPELLAQPAATADESAWYRIEPRTTETNRADLEMSGDFRKY